MLLEFELKRVQRGNTTVYMTDLIHRRTRVNKSGGGEGQFTPYIELGKEVPYRSFHKHWRLSHHSETSLLFVYVFDRIITPQTGLFPPVRLPRKIFLLTIPTLDDSQPSQPPVEQLLPPESLSPEWGFPGNIFRGKLSARGHPSLLEAFARRSRHKMMLSLSCFPSTFVTLNFLLFWKKKNPKKPACFRTPGKGEIKFGNRKESAIVMLLGHNLPLRLSHLARLDQRREICSSLSSCSVLDAYGLTTEYIANNSICRLYFNKVRL